MAYPVVAPLVGECVLLGVAAQLDLADERVARPRHQLQGGKGYRPGTWVKLIKIENTTATTYTIPDFVAKQ